MGHVGQRGLGRFDRVQPGRDMKRSQVLVPGDDPLRRRINAHRPPNLFAAVYQPVPNHSDCTGCGSRDIGASQQP